MNYNFIFFACICNFHHLSFSTCYSLLLLFPFLNLIETLSSPQLVTTILPHSLAVLEYPQPWRADRTSKAPSVVTAASSEEACQTPPALLYQHQQPMPDSPHRSTLLVRTADFQMQVSHLFIFIQLPHLPQLLLSSIQHCHQDMLTSTVVWVACLAHCRPMVVVQVVGCIQQHIPGFLYPRQQELLTPASFKTKHMGHPGKISGKNKHKLTFYVPPQLWHKL